MRHEIKWSTSAANDLAGFGDGRLARELMAVADEDLGENFPPTSGNPDQGIVEEFSPAMAWRRAIRRDDAAEIASMGEDPDRESVNLPGAYYWLIYRPPTQDEYTEWLRQRGKTLDFVVVRVLDAKAIVRGGIVLQAFKEAQTETETGSGPAGERVDLDAPPT